MRRAADLHDVYADDDLFSKKGFSGFAKMIGEDWDLVPTEITGEHHAKIRRVLNPVFAPQKMFSLDESVRHRARALIADFAHKGYCDFVKEFAVPFPVSIFLDLFGLPQEQIPQFLAWEHGLLHTTDMAERIAATPGRQGLSARRDRAAPQKTHAGSHQPGFALRGRRPQMDRSGSFRLLL